VAGYALEPIGKAICDAAGYTFGTAVGSGAFKETFSATDGDGRSLAIKVLRPGCSNERSDREIEAMKRCSHPNVAALVELSTIEVDGSRYTFLIEDFMAGGTLDDRIKNGPIDRLQVLGIGECLIHAIEHIAARDLVHRDIKPANIMFANDHSDAVVGDFGIVRDLTKESLTQSYLALGPCTPYFAAPEQLNNDKALIDWRTDQFAVATTLCVAHFGFHPYRAEEDQDDQAVHRVVARSGPSEKFVATAHAQGLPVLATMLAPWPVQRYRTPSLLRSAWTAQRGGE
jgi:serine/threonine protein kinase